MINNLFYSSYINRTIEDKSVMGRICFDILNQEEEQKTESDEFCGVFIEGRDRPITSFEDFASFKAFFLFSQYSYPVFLFLNENVAEVLTPELVKKYRINIVKIKPLENLFQYSDFCINQLFKLIPEKFENILTFQPDGFLIKPGWEKFVTDNNFSYIGAAWRHWGGVMVERNKEWHVFNEKRTNMANGAVSFRKRSKMLKATNLLKKSHLKSEEIIEMGNADYKPALEDLFYSYFLFCVLGEKPPTVEQCNQFVTDPCDWQDYSNKISFGVHCPKKINEWKK